MLAANFSSQLHLEGKKAAGHKAPAAELKTSERVTSCY